MQKSVNGKGKASYAEQVNLAPGSIFFDKRNGISYGKRQTVTGRRR